MPESPSRAASAAGSALPGGISFRSVFAGTVLMILFSFTLPYNDYKLFSTYLTGNFLPIAVVLVLAVLTLGVNVLWRAGLAGAVEFLVGLWGIAVALFGLIADLKDLLDIVPLAAALVAALVAARACSLLRKDAARRTGVLGWAGAGVLLFAALEMVFPLGGLLAVLWRAASSAQVPEVGADFFHVSASRALMAAALAADAGLVLACASRAARRGGPSFDPMRVLYTGVFVAFGFYAASRLAFESGTGVSGGVAAFLGMVVLIGLGTLVSRLRDGRAARVFETAISSTRGRPAAAICAGLIACWLGAGLFWGLLAGAAAALGAESARRLARSSWRPRAKDLWVFVPAGLAAAAIVAALVATTRRWEWVAAIVGLLALSLVGLADARVAGAIDWLLGLGLAAGLPVYAVTGGAAGAILAGSSAAFAAFSLAGNASFLADPARCFSKGELMVIFVLMFAGSGVPSSGLIRYLHPSMVAPAYYAAPENQWETRLLPHIPDFLTPSKDPADPVVTRFFEGYRREELEKAGVSAWEAIPWGRWVGPTVSWMVFVGSCYFMFLCLAVLLRKQWDEHERLSFPMLQVPLEMADDPPKGGLVGGFFRNKMVWLGAAVPIVVHGVNGLAQLNPKVPSIELVTHVWGLFWDKPHWNAIEFFWLEVLFTIVGIAYLLPTEVSLSMWFFWLLFQAELFFGSVANMTLAGAQLRTHLTQHQYTGCYIAYALFLVWTARHHIADIFRKVRGPWSCPGWGLVALACATPAVYALSRRSGETHAEAAALALVYLLVVPLGKFLSGLAETAPEGDPRRSLAHLSGMGTVAALAFSFAFGWNAFVPLAAALVEARRRARVAPVLGPVAGWASWVPAAVCAVALLAPGAASGARTFLAAALAAYVLALPLPWLMRRRFGRESAALVSQVAASVLIPAVAGQYTWDSGRGALAAAALPPTAVCRSAAELAGWAVSAGVAYLLLGPVAGFLRGLSGSAAEVDDSKEGMSYRSAVAGLVASALGCAYLAATTVGMSFGIALAVIAVLLMVSVIFARIVAQGGLPFIQHRVRPRDLLNALGGPTLSGLAPPTEWGARSQVMMLWLDNTFIHDMRETAMPAMVCSFRMGEEATKDRRKLLWIIVLSFAVAVVVSSVVRIYLSYANGGLTLEAYSMYHSPRNHFGAAVSAIQNPQEFRPGLAVGMGIGMALTAFVLVMFSRFYWWPLHPIGLLMFPFYALFRSVFSIFLGWLCKTAIWTFGGESGVKKMRPFFLGLVLGDCLIGGFWVVVGFVMGQKVLSIMPT